MSAVTDLWPHCGGEVPVWNVPLLIQNHRQVLTTGWLPPATVTFCFWCAAIRWRSIYILYFVPTGKNRPSSQGKWWRLQPVCIITHKSASLQHRRRHRVGREHQWSPWQHTQCDAGKGNSKEGRERLAEACWICVEEMCGWLKKGGGGGGGEL